MQIVQQGDGNVLELKAQKGTAGKCAISLDLGVDFTSRGVLTLQIENTGKVPAPGEAPLAAAIAVDSGLYYESRQIPLRPGANEIKINIAAGDFKCKPNWTHDSKIQGLNYVIHLYLLLYGGADTTFRIDNVYVKRAQ
jgi:hypothetical protein